ncbi:hypothetical protein BDV97DRAFT_231390 [Delphinella strobiligena]|nr:hypothetical protein BDV97DRAFT_231390 [Delphinella strobiligena]
MAKDKSTKKAAPAAKPVAVKEGRVTKTTDTPKAKSKEVAKKAAKVTEKESKKSKKSKKEPTPEPESESSDSDEEMASGSSDSSDSESEEEAKPAAKTNGAAKKVAVKKEESSDSESDSSSEEEKPAAKAAVKAESDSDDSTDSESDEEEKPAAKAAAVKKSDSSDDSSDSDSDEEESAEEKPAKVEEPSKKRKAETEAAPAASNKKVKHEGDFSAPSNVLFVGGLSWNVDEDWLSREFEECSPVSVRVITHADSGRSKGFAYVEFADTDAAIEALNTKHGVELDGRALRCDFSSPRQPKQDGDRANNRAQQYGDKKSVPSATLFCGNLSFDTTQDSLTGYFSEFGSINGIRLPTDRETGAPKGYGYIEFSSIEEAQGALDTMNGADVDGRAIRLDYSTPRDPSTSGGFGGGRGGGRGGRGGFGDRGGRGGGRGGRGGFGDRGGRGGSRGGRGGFPPSTNRGGFGDFKGKKMSFE